MVLHPVWKTEAGGYRQPILPPIGRNKEEEVRGGRDGGGMDGAEQC